MKQKKKKQLTHWLSVIVVGIALGLGLQFVRAWTEPTSSPPNGNVGAPINTSSAGQTKTGDLNVKGGMVIGDATGGPKGVGTINATQFCLSGACISAWPTGTNTNTNTIPVTPLYTCPDLGGSSIGDYGRCWNCNTCTGETSTYSTCEWYEWSDYRNGGSNECIYHGTQTCPRAN